VNELINQARKHRRLLLTLMAIIIPLAIIVLAITRISARASIETLTAAWSNSGHADYTAQSFTFWDENDPPLIPANCATCHSLHGILDFLGERGTPAGSVSHDMPIGTVVSCLACHNNAAHQMSSVTFPSGAVVNARESAEATCLQCHQGTESTASVNEAIAGLDDDVVSDQLGFINVHYHVAAATLMGTTAQGGYEYPGMQYVGRFEHTSDFQSCHSCHNPHHLRVEPLVCSTCHVNVRGPDDLRLIRQDRTDYDGDGDTRTGIALEIDNFHALLYQAIRAYAAEVIGAPILYDSTRFPYYFVDVSNGGEVDPADLHFGNRFTQWTPRLVRAAYNYHFVQKDPGAYAHNPRYVLQFLYDSLHDLNERVPVALDALQRPQTR
jgi:hypothetical protein